jgi:hypothetical protein
LVGTPYFLEGVVEGLADCERYFVRNRIIPVVCDQNILIGALTDFESATVYGRGIVPYWVAMFPWPHFAVKKLWTMVCKMPVRLI